MGQDSEKDGAWFVEARTFPCEEEGLSLIPPTHVDSGADPSPEDAAGEQLAPLAGRAVIVESNGRAFLSTFTRALPDLEPPLVLDLQGFTAFLHPARGSNAFAALWERFIGSPPTAQPDAKDLRDFAHALVVRHFQRATPLRQLFARGLEETQASCSVEEAGPEGWLEIARRLLDRPSRWTGDPEDSQGTPLRDGMFGQDLDDSPLEMERPLSEIEPRFHSAYKKEFEPFPETKLALEPSEGLPQGDLETLEAFFDHLPSHFQTGQKGGATERPGQRAFAHAVEATLAGKGFLLADAPTGTGKTLAYLAPMLLWSVRHEVRVGVSTYTRALQEQAFFREVPRALEILRQSGVEEEDLPRICMLKGRANYICGRALADSVPEAGSTSAAASATWLRLALFWAEDPSGDLDGFGLPPGLPFPHPARADRAAGARLAQARAMPACCFGTAGGRCAAAVRTMKADRAHLVFTNHAYVLSRPEAFAHLVFDECDHLHEVTLSVRSYDIELDEVAELARNLRTGRGRDRSPLERLQHLVERGPSGSSSSLGQEMKRALDGVAKLDASGHACARGLKAFQAWRDKEAGDRSPEERAFLLHDWLHDGRGDALVTSLHALRRSIDQLDGSLRTVIEELGDRPQRSAKRLCGLLRRPLEVVAHWREGLGLWLGGESEDGDFSEQFHYHTVFEGRRRPLLALQWILPQEWLGETYLPSLKNAILVSATARLQGGFESMKSYLGLDRVEEDTLAKEGRAVETFTGPPTFDPKAALVCIPEDAPPYGYRGPEAEAWIDYVEDLLVFLGERTQGRILGLFTNRQVLGQVGRRLEPAFRAKGIPLLWQGMPGVGKEDLLDRFRSTKESILLGVDTFWYGVDLPGDTCQYVVMTKLPYGPLDDYAHAQMARMGRGPWRNRIYMPKALAMFRQGCGRLLRKEDDRGAIFILDRRALEKRHGHFLRELPGGMEEWEEPDFLVADSDRCLEEVFAHMGLAKELEERGLVGRFSECRGRVG